MNFHRRYFDLEKFSRDIKLLNEGVCWVVFRFSDQSLKMICTTLRVDLLEEIKPKENALYDFDTLQWFSLFRVKGSQIEIYKSRPQLKEVDLFANKFIR